MTVTTKQEHATMQEIAVYLSCSWQKHLTVTDAVENSATGINARFAESHKAPNLLHVLTDKTGDLPRV